MAVPRWWLDKHLRTVRWYQYENGKRLEQQRRQGAGPDGAVTEERDESTERSLSHGDQ